MFNTLYCTLRNNCQFVLFCLELDPEEREELQKEIQELKDEIASMKSGSVLGDQTPKDIVRKHIIVALVMKWAGFL